MIAEIWNLRRWILQLIVAVAVCGCDAREADQRPAATALAGSGVIRGRVKFTGSPPVMKTIENRPCHDAAEPIHEEFVVVNDNGTLRNVIVYLEGAPRVDGASAQPALLDQVSCRYVPHVLAVQTGQKIRVRSSDPTLHNVHCLASKNRAVNFGMTGAGQERTISFDAPEIFPVKCDVHPWMIAYIGVFGNPWFDVTDDSGHFEITKIPAGSYTILTWHERYGPLKKDVIVDDGQSVDLEFEYKAP